MSRRSDGLARRGLAVYRRLPAPVRRWLVRRAAPSYTVGTICVVLDGERVLLVRHSYRQRWGAPGGLLDRGELPDATAVRETTEEAGIAIAIDEGPFAVVMPRLRRIDLAYRARPAPGVDPGAVAARSPEILEVRWFPLADLPELQPDTADAMRAVGLRPVSRSPRRTPP